LTPVTIQSKTLVNAEGTMQMVTQDENKQDKITTQYVLDITNSQYTSKHK